MCETSSLQGRDNLEVLNGSRPEPALDKSWCPRNAGRKEHWAIPSAGGVPIEVGKSIADPGDNFKVAHARLNQSGI
jgi:hypothetical protein